jgi:hypothetical protein
MRGLCEEIPRDIVYRRIVMTETKRREGEENTQEKSG